MPYAREYNPTTAILEARLASLEGAEACLAVATGMTAIGTLMLSLLSQGDEVVVNRGGGGAGSTRSGGANGSSGAPWPGWAGPGCARRFRSARPPAAKPPRRRWSRERVWFCPSLLGVIPPRQRPLP